MAHTPDDPNDPVDRGGMGRDEGARKKLDEDAAWREIIAHYGDEPTIEDLLAEDSPSSPAPDEAGTPDDSGTPPAADTPPAAPPTQPEPPIQPEPPSDERLRGLFRPTWDDPLETGATWEDEGHFVPPNPPPMPALDPRRRAAWAGLFGSPMLMLVAVVLGWNLPHWVMFFLAVSFTGGFVYLVATMQKRRDGSGDDGAVV